MTPRSFAAFVLLIFANSADATSWDDDSHYVSLGPRNGYYIVSPDSRLLRQLGLYEAPVIDTADWMRHGHGADALAFRFNRNGPEASCAHAMLPAVGAASASSNLSNGI